MLVASILLASVVAASSPNTAAAAVSCPVPTAGTPGISLTKDAPTEALYAEPIPITLTASQPASPPGDPESGFNLTFRDVLPPGVSYVPGSASVAPQQIADQPAPGYTTLIFSNVADLAPGSTTEFRYEVEYDPLVYAPGDTVVTGTAIAPQAAAAYVNCNPRWVPRFDSSGLPTGTPLDSASSSASTPPAGTLIKAIEIEKSEPSPEGELLRGVHDNKTAYTLTVRNNTQYPTNGIHVVDYLPAGLEFLGCGDVDNTTDAPTNPGSPNEYPGSGPISAGANPALPDSCPAPISVEFGTFDPDGPGPAGPGQYTRVEWDLGANGDIPANGSFSFNYVAAIPICPNTSSWTGSTPTASSLGQTANLDNNNCADGETIDETALTNHATANGDYDGPGGVVPVTDTTTETVTAEDLAIWKEATDDDFGVGSTIRWRLHIRTSEYRTFSNTTITDTAPDGTCPVVGSEPPASPSGDAPCAPTGDSGDDPIPAWNSATENADGTWSISWNLPSLQSNEETVVAFSTMVREYYQENFNDERPVLVGDSLTNLVSIAGAGDPICSTVIGVIPCVGPNPPYIEHTQPPGTELTDESDASVGSGRPTLDKQVATPSSLSTPVDCSTAAGASYQHGTASFYRPGDLVCWKIRVNFPSTVSTGGITLTDYLPLGTSYVPGVPGTGVTGDSNLTVTSVDDNGTFLDFHLDVVDDTVDPGSHVFEYILATEIDNNGFPGTELPILRGNLLKMTTSNSEGVVTTDRATADAEVESPQVSLTKGVVAVNGDGGISGAPDDVVVDGGNIVTFNVDVANSSAVDAVDSVVEEFMPAPYVCADFSNYANAGIATSAGCFDEVDGARITWTGVDIDAGSSTTLAFDFTVPDISSPFVSIPDVACVYSFANETNQPFPNDRFQHYPDNSETAGCTTPPGPTVTPPANDPSKVIGGGSFTKSQTTSVDETNNNASSQATIGETIDYTVSFVLPPHMSVENMTITDPVPTGLTYVGGSVAGARDGGALPGGMGAGTPGGVPTLLLGNYTNSTGSPQTFTLTWSATVDDAVGNVSGTQIANTARRSFTDQFGTAHSNVASNTTTTTVVEPNPTIVKTSTPASIVSPGEEVQYTVSLSNPNRGSGPASSPLHEAVVSDVVPIGITLTDGNGNPLADGGSTALCDGSAPANVGTWDASTRTITWNYGDLAPGATPSFVYCAEIDSSPAPAAGQQLTNTATVSGTSMPGSVTGERTYETSDDNTVTVAGSAITKIADPTTAPVGKTIQYTVTVTLPSDTQFYGYRAIDTLPAGMTHVSFISSGCAGVGCGSVPTPSTSVSGQNLTWSYGNIPSSNATRTLTLVYSAIVDDVPGNQQGAVLTNSAGQSWCTIATEPCPPENQVSPPPATAPVTVTEPDLAIDKDVNCQVGDSDTCDIQPGDSFSYSITVTNNGDGTAYDAVFQDQVPAQLTNVVVGALPSGVTATAPTPPNTHAWVIDSLAPSASVTVTYTADLVGSTLLSNPFTVVNTARVTQYWGLDDSERAGNPDAREYPEGAEPEDTVTLNGHLPEPSIVKTVANSGNAELNQPIQWTLTIGNESAYADLFDIDIEDQLPAGWEYQAGSAQLDAAPLADPTIVGAVPSGQLLQWTNIGDIAAGGADKVLTFNAIPRASALTAGDPTNPYVNNAVVSGDDASGSSLSASGPYRDSDDESANIQMPNLSIVKTPDNQTVVAGSWNNWTIVLTNNGPGTARDVVLREAVPAGLFYNFTTHPLTASCSPTPCDNLVGPSSSPGGGSVSSGTGPHSIYWTLDSLAPGQSLTLTLPMMPPANAAEAASWTNDAYAHSTERPTDVTDSGSWNATREADLAITKVGTPKPGTAGENVTYTLTVTNNGASTANGVTVDDAIDTSQFEFVSVTPSDTVNDSCLTTGSPIDHVTCKVGDEMGVGATATFTLVLKVKSGLTGSVSNTATVDGDEFDPDEDNNTSTEVVPLGTVADLTITKVVSTGQPSEIFNHDQTAFTITVHNNGPSDALSTTVTDELPDGLSCVSTTPPAASGCPGAAGGTVTWNLGTVEAGDTVILTMVVRGEQVGDDWENVATVHSPTDPTDSSDSDFVTVNPMADLEIEKTAPGNVASGANFDYELTVTNNGPDSAVTPTVSDTLPTGLIYVGYDSEGDLADCSISGQVFTCTLPTLDEGDSLDITIHVNAGFSYNEECIDNTAQTTSTTHDSDSSNNSDSAEACIGPNADVAIVKSGPAFGADGWPLTYTLSVVNNGPAMAQNVIVSDPLPAGLTYQSSQTNVGSCSEAANVVTCDLADMAPGATAQITIVAVPDASVVGTTVHNVASVESETPDSNTSNNQDDVDTPIENHEYPTSSDMAIAKTISNATPSVGDEVTYTIVATNRGPDTARSVVVTDTLPSGLIYVSASGDGACAFASPVLTCQLGDVPAGESRTIRLRAIIARTGSVVNVAVVNAANDRDPGDNTATAPAQARKSTARIAISKKASKRTVKVGGKAKYTIKVKNVSKVTAVNVEVCDLIPARLSVVRKDGGVLKSGNLCWSIPVLKPGSSRTFKPVFRVNNGRSTSITNPVRASAYNAKTVRAKAKIRVPRRAARGGGTTG